MSTLHVQVGDAQSMGQRFTQAFHRAQTGDLREERHITFLSFEAMTASLTPKRLALLRHLHSMGGANSIKAIAAALGRDYSRVHGDVVALEAAGLILREDGRLTAPWVSLATEIVL